LNGQAEDFARLERVVPPGFERHFYFQVGMTAMERHSNELPKAIAAVDFLRHRSAAAHHLALVGIYRMWRPSPTALDRPPEALATTPAGVPPALAPHYWRAFGNGAGWYWYDNERSLSLLTARLQSFVPRLNPTVQRAFLHGVGEWLFAHFINTPGIAPAELERFPQAYQESLFEGWGTALGEFELLGGFPWHGQESPYWTAWTKGFSARSLASIQRGKAQFEALFEGPLSSAPAPPRRAP
jgi:hypothetical protein